MKTRLRVNPGRPKHLEDAALGMVFGDRLIFKLEAAAQLRGFRSVRELIDHYYNVKLRSQNDMGTIFGVGRNAIFVAMKVLGMEARPPQQTLGVYWRTAPRGRWG